MSLNCWRRIGWIGFATLMLALASARAQEGRTVKRIVRLDPVAKNLLDDAKWRPYGQGFTRDGQTLICDNGAKADAQRGAAQTIVLNQSAPQPIVAAVSSRADGIGGARNSDYSLYLDLVYTDGDHLWGRAGNFDVGTHDWQRQEVRIMPEKPVKSVSVNLLLRGHAGKATFKDAVLQQINVPASAGVFDGLITLADKPAEGLLVRDVAADGDFVAVDAGGAAAGLKIELKKNDGPNGASFFDCRVSDTTGKDRAITLVYALPVKAKQFMADLRRAEPVSPGREYRWLDHTGRISHWPLAAVVDADGQGAALGIDMARPAIFRVGYGGAGELYIAYDLALCPEKPSASVRFYTTPFAPQWGLRGTIEAMYGLFPEQFQTRVKRQGLWMPFYAISKVKGWEDFGFAFKEGDSETAWDDAHDIVTFRYTEPMTWWMKLPKGTARTMDEALAEARRMAEKGDARAKSLLATGFHDEQGRFVARLMDTPWCDGAVWSMNSLPGLSGPATDFGNKWNPQLKEKLYGASRKADLDGEYVDSIEGWVTDDLDYRRDHFAAATTPLTFDPRTCKPAIHKGLIVFEYTRAMREDLKPLGKFMMANGAGSRFCWLVSLLDVNGTETNWNPRGKWNPTSDRNLGLIRALCGAKPYCFLMNTNFDEFGADKVEKFMKRSLAYGMFPGFFSPDASRGHYFSRPELYDRDRPLFKRYVPLCKRVAEATWQPVPLARSSHEKLYVERWGKDKAGKQYLTIFNDSPDKVTATITLDGLTAATAFDHISGKTLTFELGGCATITLAGEDVALWELR